MIVDLKYESEFEGPYQWDKSCDIELDNVYILPSYKLQVSREEKCLTLDLTGNKVTLPEVVLTKVGWVYCYIVDTSTGNTVNQFRIYIKGRERKEDITNGEDRD